MTDLRTDGLTRVGAKDTCVSKNKAVYSIYSIYTYIVSEYLNIGQKYVRYATFFQGRFIWLVQGLQGGASKRIQKDCWVRFDNKESKKKILLSQNNTHGIW